jgi:hypothetical protein
MIFDNVAVIDTQIPSKFPGNYLFCLYALVGL